MHYRIELTPAAEKALVKLAKKDRALMVKIDHALLSLAENPMSNNSKRLVGGEGDLYRLRVGDYRIIYRVENGQLLVLVVHLGHRKDVYRHLKR